MRVRPSRLALAAATAVAALGAVAAPAPAAPAPAGPSVHFAVKGDWGWGGPEQAAVTRRMCAESARDPLAFVLTTGDNFYNPDGTATAANWSRPEACLIRARVPWHAAWGNHDEAGGDTARLLGARRPWYTFVAGPARVVVLDANRPSDPAQRAFLARVLAGAREPDLIVAFHQPAYTAGLHPPGTVQAREWAPLFRRHHVTLVLQGHNHLYERLRVGGVTYVTTGGGGAPLYPCLRAAAGLATCRSVHNFLLVTATGAGLDVRAVRPDGGTIERFTLPPRRPA